MFVDSYRRKAFNAFLLWYAGSNLFFGLITTLNVVYQFKVAHLTPLQLVLVGTTLESTALLAQVPTGVIADVFSRRTSLAIGTFLVGAGFTLEGLVPAFWSILVAQIIWGLGSTMLDGADAAWLAEELGTEYLEQVYIRIGQIIATMSFITIPLSILLGSIRLNLPVVSGGSLMMVLAILTPFFLPEEHFQPPARADRSTLHVMVTTARIGWHAVRSSKSLLMLMAIEAFLGLASEGWDRLWQPFLLARSDLPGIGPSGVIAWIGIIALLGNGIGLILNGIVARRLARQQRLPTLSVLLVLHGLRIGAILLFAFGGHWLTTTFAVLTVGALMSVFQPLYDARFAGEATASARATIISMRGLVNASGQIAGGPLVGAVGNRSLRLAFVLVTLFLTPVLPLLNQLRRKSVNTIEQLQTPDSNCPDR